MRGRATARWRNPSPKVIRPNESWKNNAARPTPAPERGGGARLLDLAHDDRAEVGQRGLRPVDRRQPVARLPVAQADEVDARALEHAPVIAQGELLHPLQDEQLDLGDLREGDQRRLILQPAHGTGTRSRMSSMTISVVTPWVAARG